MRLARTVERQNTAARLFSYLRGQRIRLAVVAVSIVIYVALSIWNPMYSAFVIDRLWESIQASWKSGTAFVTIWDANFFSCLFNIFLPGYFIIFNHI